MIHNRYLPMWLHRVCNGVFGTAVFASVGSFWISEPPGAWLHMLSLCLLGASVPAGIILALVAHRFSIVQGLAGRAGYDELHDADRQKQPKA